VARSGRRARGFVVASAFSAPPTISGTAQVGATLTGTNGTLVGATFTSRQWKRDGMPIAGATALTYVVQAADVGRIISLDVLVTLTNGAKVVGSAGPTAVVIA
jgi:hypothetical protein